MTTPVKRLYKSSTDKMLGGVCGGIAEYFQVDSALVRLAFIFLLFLGGIGFLLYLVGLVIMPRKPEESAAAGPAAAKTDGVKIWGIILIAVGGLIFLSNIGFSFWQDWWRVPWRLALPLVLLGVGVWVLLNRREAPGTAPVPSGTTPSPAGEPSAPPTGNGSTRLFRSRTESKLFGVCGGVGRYLNADPTIVRILFIIAAFASAGMMILLYFIMALVVPLEPPAPTQPTEVPQAEKINA
jgi:phage shock protein PspC (stress-responsive transcriptional regulator)